MRATLLHFINLVGKGGSRRCGGECCARGASRTDYNLVFIFIMAQRIRAICGTRSRSGSMRIASKSFATEDDCCLFRRTTV